MRRLSILISTVALVLSGLAMSPAHAVADGPVNCGSSGTFTITTNVVTASDSCAGAVEIAEGVTSIGDYAFYYATSLTSITIPASVTSIGDGAFSNATSLNTITFASDSKLASIGVTSFENSALTSITIPASVTSIGEGAFYDTTSLTSITVAGTNPNYSSANGVLFNKLYKTLITYPAGKTVTSYSIPASVTSIGEGAFTSATSLTSVTIPASVTTLGNFAFLIAASLTNVYFWGDAPTTVVANAFFGVATGAKAYIKSGNTSFGSEETWNGLVLAVGVYTATFNTTGGSEVNAQDYGANIATPTSPTRIGYTFAGWSATDGGSVITFPHTPALGSDITLYAKWTRNSAKAAAKVKPTVSGTAKVSKTLTAKKGTWSGYPNPALTYQWYSCTKKVTVAKASVPSTCKKITGATKSKLKLVKAQKGKFISVLVTGKGTGTSATKWLSKSTSKVK